MTLFRLMTAATLILAAHAYAFADVPAHPFWTELQDGWREDNDAHGAGRPVVFHEVLGTRNIPVEIPIARKVARPRMGGDLVIYLNGASAAKAYLNGTLLEYRQISPAEKTFAVPASLWGDTNTLRLVLPPGIGYAITAPRPALFLTTTSGIERLRSGTITIDAESLRSGGTIDLSGPVFLYKVDHDQYNAFTGAPKETFFPLDGRYTVSAPSPLDHILKNLGHDRLAYEFFITFSGVVETPVVLRMDTVRGPDELYIDGTPAGKTGVPGDQSRLYYDRTRIYSLPGTMFTPGKPHRVTVITHRPTHSVYGSIDGPAFRIASADSEFGDFTRMEIIAVAFSAVYLIIGLYYGFLWIRRVSYWEYIFFAISAICLATYFFLRTQSKYLFFDDFFTLKRIEYIILFLLIPSMALFMHFLFKPRGTATEKIFRVIFYLYLPIGLASVLMPVFIPDINTWNRMLVSVQLTWSVPMLYIIYLITREAMYFLVKKISFPFGSDRSGHFFDLAERALLAARRPWNAVAGALPPRLSAAASLTARPFERQVLDTDADGALMITAVFIMLAAAVHDILLENNVISGTRLTSYGTLLFVLGIAVILTGRIFRLYARVGELNRGLNSAVEASEKHAGHLRDIIQGVNGASRDLVTISEQLDEIGHSFASMAENEARGSAGLSATFQELMSSTERISESAELQAGEGAKTTALVETFNETQKDASEMIGYVLGHIADITRSKNDTVRHFNDMIGKMRIINDGGAQINNFVQIINDITDKINLLSLNASIEAARAGEHGRGFAVVADEISKLAAATSDNSREISSQINIILNDIREGMIVVDTTKASTDSIFSLLDEINSRIDSVEGIIRRQSEAFANVLDQAGVIHRHAMEIASLTANQKRSMSLSGDTVNGLSAIAGRIEESSRGILSLTGEIKDKTQSLRGLVQGID